tara:strand:- start:26 stop:385 length:360 start_codon:yes stop_codon:yes gene_type:complete
MKHFNELQEGVYDPNIFKAFFIAGGPGSGKSFVVRRTTGGLGLRVVNSDDAFEAQLKKANLSLKMPSSEQEPRMLFEIEQNKQLHLENQDMSKVVLVSSLMVLVEILTRLQKKQQNYNN